MYLALEGKKIVGMITLRNVSHISLLFVDKEYHHKGVGTALIKTVSKYIKTEAGLEVLTVNASPYAVGFYHKLGFIDTGLLSEADGITYTPMELLL